MRWLALLLWCAALGAVEVITATADEHASGTNSHLLLGTDTAILVDVPLTISAAQAWQQRLPGLLAGRTLAQIYITDSHPDHGGSLPWWRERYPTVPIRTRPAVLEDLRRDGPVYHQRLRARLGAEIPEPMFFPDPHADDHLLLDGQRLPLVPLDGGHSSHMTGIILPGGRMLSCEAIYHRQHAYLRERRVAGWRANLDQLERLTKDQGITHFIPSHGEPCGVEGIATMRRYLDAVEKAAALPDRASAETALRAAFPDYRMVKFLTDYTLPAYFP